jgi:hypothetical protein
MTSALVLSLAENEGPDVSIGSWADNRLLNPAIASRKQRMAFMFKVWFGILISLYPKGCQIEKEKAEEAEVLKRLKLFGLFSSSAS